MDCADETAGAFVQHRDPEPYVTRRTLDVKKYFCDVNGAFALGENALPEDFVNRSIMRRLVGGRHGNSTGVQNDQLHEARIQLAVMAKGCRSARSQNAGDQRVNVSGGPLLLGVRNLAVVAASLICA